MEHTGEGILGAQEEESKLKSQALIAEVNLRKVPGREGQWFLRLFNAISVR